MRTDSCCAAALRTGVVLLLLATASSSVFGSSPSTDMFVQIEDSTSGRSSAEAHQAVYLEAVGNNLGYSFNYDRVLFGTDLRKDPEATPLFLTMRVGADVPRFLALPIMLTLLTGSDHHFELGLGVIYMPSHYMPYSGTLGGREKYIFSTGTIGYRYQRFDARGIVLRIGVTPIFETIGFIEHSTLPFLLSGGVSVGYGF